MKQKITSLLIITLLIFPTLSMITTAHTYYSLGQNDTLYVDDDNTQGPWLGTPDHPYQYIGDAVQNASDNDSIYVYNGIYYENILIDKTLYITGENATSTIIDGMYNEYIIKITKDKVIIHNFTFRNAGGYKYNAGIILNSNTNQITHCMFHRTKTGIFVNKTKSNNINHCTFTTNGEGIYLYSSQENIIQQCFFSHNALGINNDQSHHNQIQQCYLHTNGIGLFFNDSSSMEISECAVYNHNDNQGGIYLGFCTTITISNCNICHNGFGCNIESCSHLTISDSNFLLNTHFAIHIDKNSEELVVEHCEFSDNFRFAFTIWDSNITIKNCNIHDSLFGIESEYSHVIAQHNYWGSAFGPALFERTTKDRIFFKFGYIKFIPWQIRQIADAGASWDIDYSLFAGEVNTTRYHQIQLAGTDSDDDGVPNWWENKWQYDPYSWDDHAHLDPDNDGLTNIEECYTDGLDSNPFYKDVFLEFDWIEPQNPNEPNKPSSHSICKATSMFAAHNITLHIDTGELGGGEEIPSQSNFSYADLRDLYWDYFLHNDLNNPRKGIFHYCLVADYGTDRGFSFFGWDHLDSFEVSAQMLQESLPQYSRDHLIISGAIHELGHTFGLFVDDHGGNDNMVATKLFTIQWWKYLSYPSIMNYWYTYRILDYSDGTHGAADFDDWGNLDFTFFKDTHFEWPKETF